MDFMHVGQPRGSTLDGPGQSAALQHLRNSGLAAGAPDYVSPDNLRDAASKLFSRNQGDRSSFGHVTPAQIHFQSQQLRFGMAQSPNGNGPPPAGGKDSVEKRHSYANHSFRYYEAYLPTTKGLAQSIAILSNE